MWTTSEAAIIVLAWILNPLKRRRERMASLRTVGVGGNAITLASVEEGYGRDKSDAVASAGNSDATLPSEKTVKAEELGEEGRGNVIGGREGEASGFVEERVPELLR